MKVKAENFCEEKWVKIISKITIDCVEHEDVVYFRWKENDWRVTGMEDDIVPINEDWQWLEDLFQEAIRRVGS